MAKRKNDASTAGDRVRANAAHGVLERGANASAARKVRLPRRPCTVAVARTLLGAPQSPEESHASDFGKAPFRGDDLTSCAGCRFWT
jgi:hypothetical protein